MIDTQISALHPTQYWHRLADGRVQCDLCPRECTLKEGQAGLCFVRACRDGRIVLTTYGRSSGFCVDPIEKKPLHHFFPGTAVLSFGTAGCNLACRYCQNWDMSKSREMDILAEQASPETIAQAAERLGCRSIAFTYNDPIVFMEYANDTAQACHELGIKTVAVTSGYISDEPRAEFFAQMDATNVDLKAFTERFYHKLTGGHLQPVLDTLVYLKRETPVWLEITTLLIPGENDSSREIDEMTRWVVENLGPDVPLHLTAFHPAWKLQGKPATPPGTLKSARRIAVANGMHFVYTGNIHDSSGGSSWCPGCGSLLIERDWYRLGTWNLDRHGCCGTCGIRIPGVFEAVPGKWGAKRVPVRIAAFG
ncbi:MAG: AmmeMemoRadiSam system radical SAM enzyme [Gammaproteobacteria bacterium]|nr:AmmeMemoRadiSam system radical SAM enzyme [Gammaproteobacteria bacterium]